MHLYRQIYEFAASAGAFEGYVYGRALDDIDLEVLSNWANNLQKAYAYLPNDVREQVQPSCDRTLGRAIQSLKPLLGAQSEIVVKLQSMIAGKLPATPDDFNKDKWFEH